MTTEPLPEAEVERGLRRVLQDGVTTQVMATLTGGPILVAFALGLGASHLQIGLLAAASALAQFSQAPGLWVLDRVHSRRRVAVAAAGLSRLLWIFVAALALWSPGPAAWYLLAAIAIHFGLGGVAGAAWTSWMRDLVPEVRMGSFFARRLRIMAAIGIPFYLVAAWSIDAWTAAFPRRPLAVYAILFGAGAAAGLAGLWLVAGTPEPLRPMGPPRPVLHHLRSTLQDRPFRRLLAFLATWNFALHLAAPFFTVYLLVRLQYSMVWVGALTVLSQLAHMEALVLWGRLSDGYGDKTVLHLAAPALLVGLLGWTMTTLPEPHRLTLPLVILLHVLLGAALAGVTLATSNLAMRASPRGRATPYLAMASLVSAASATTAPILGGALIDVFAVRQLTFDFTYTAPSGVLEGTTFSLSHWDFLFVIAILVGLYALHRLGLVEEPAGPRPRPTAYAVLGDLRQEMRNLSTVAGLRSMIQFPLNLVRRRRR